ncbi:MAG TPA: response regulator [Rhizomicrobium sp.]|nr:response regulator [Rhizomicrobium sp.]
MSEASSERALILAPNGRDSQVATQLLEEAGFSAFICSDLHGLCDELHRGAGLAIIADEAVRNADLQRLARFLGQQPPWSDIPVVLLTRHGGGIERNPSASRLAELLGNVTFLERPFHPTTLTSIVRTAVRARRRQYEARARLEDLREGEKRLETALKAGRLGPWTYDIDSKTLHASEHFRAHFGRGRTDTFTVADFEASVHPDDLDAVRAAVAQMLKSGEDYKLEYRILWPDRSVHWVEVRGQALRNSAGAISQLVGVSSDITARKNAQLEQEKLLEALAAERTALATLTRTLEQRVQERTDELLREVATRQKAQEQVVQLQKIESIGQLTGGVAHDFNNLLMAVMGNLELLRKRLPDDPRFRRLIDGALQGAQRGAALTQRMLAFARQQELKTASVDVPSLISGMRDLLERSLGPQIAFSVKASENLPPAQIDANQIELAILNLAINARDAMPDGGTITIVLDETHVSRGSALQSGSYIRVRLIDTGTGMDSATLKKAIEPFFSTKPLGKGTGLGLSMVHGLAVQLGGLLELSSEVGKGTTATLWLPAAVRQAEAETAIEPNVAAVCRATILVVDDDPLIAMSTVDMLEDLGHTVIEANSAHRALEIIEGGASVDLVMTDQAMPGMTGVQLAEILRRKRPEMPILLATGYADLPAGQQSMLPRLSKPYHQAQLRSEINRLLQAGRR